MLLITTCLCNACMYLADSIRSLFTTVIALSFPPTFTLREREGGTNHAYIVIISYIFFFLFMYSMYAMLPMRAAAVSRLVVSNKPIPV